MAALWPAHLLLLLLLRQLLVATAAAAAAKAAEATAAHQILEIDAPLLELEELGGRPARAADEQHQEKRPTGRGQHHVDVAPKLKEDTCQNSAKQVGE